MKNSLSRFRFSCQVRVRNYEVDWQGIVHNANYLLYFEVGRIEYLKHLGIKISLDTIRNNSKVVLVRNELNYKEPACFDDLLNVFTRIMYIRDSSFAFEGVLQNSKSKRIIGDNIAVHVWIDPKTGRPLTVSPGFRSIIRKFEGARMSMVEPIVST
ncbi:MAG TPA: thioesterase family protein [Bacteroidota bacterium]|nr:thioesterase family protein [Bacteroidota bacterium]